MGCARLLFAVAKSRDMTRPWREGMHVFSLNKQIEKFSIESTMY
jgi:hypothetical protein